jgi:carbon-monoxide dehydrogenase large subunit
MAAMKFGFGQALTRKEDDPLLRGAGCYVADVSPPGVLHAVVLRSPHAHATFTIAELDRVKAMPGVRLVLTGAETASLGPLPTPGVLEGGPCSLPTNDRARQHPPGRQGWRGVLWGRRSHGGATA